MQTKGITQSEGHYTNTLQVNKIKASIVVGNAVLMLMGFGFAYILFSYGMQVPFQARLRGDAAEYFKIAYQFHSLHEALFYT